MNVTVTEIVMHETVSQLLIVTLKAKIPQNKGKKGEKRKEVNKYLGMQNNRGPKLRTIIEINESSTWLAHSQCQNSTHITDVL